MSSEDKWFEEYTDRLMLQHLCLLEDHLLEMVRDPSDQCQSCMFWHVFKIRSYASLECVKFSEGEHKEACITISPFMDQIEAEMEKGLTKEKSLDLAKEVREWRYRIVSFQGEDKQIEEGAMSSNPGNPWSPPPGAIEHPDYYKVNGHYLSKIHGIALSTCEVGHGLARKLDSCVTQVQQRNIEQGCPPEGLGTSECPVPYAVCRASISQPVCQFAARQSEDPVAVLDPYGSR